MRVVPLAATFGGRIAIGVADESQDVRVVQEPIHGGAGEQRVAEELVQLVGVAVGGDDGRGPLVTQPYELASS